MDKQAAQDTIDTMMGNCALRGAVDALKAAGHHKAAERPEKVLQAIEGMDAIATKEAERQQPIINEADLTGLDALADYAPDEAGDQK